MTKGFVAALGVGFLAGASATVALLARPIIVLPRIAPITSTGEQGEIVESFFSEAPGDAVALTHSGKVPFAPFPRNVGLFTEPPIERGLALVVRLKNAAGETVGFAAELEVHPEAGALEGDSGWDTDWTVVLPGRGALFLHQREEAGELGSTILKPVLASREPWQGDLSVQTTVGPRLDRRGIVVGGAGEFEGARGWFVEIDRIRRVTPDGVLEGTFELRIAREAR